jgi:[lysine-biosynthesis-protein LysW]--L-2-aminoadipate ligase
MRIVLIAHRESETNLRLVEAAPRDVAFELLSPSAAIRSLEPGDAALARLDVLPTVDGIEPGIWEIGRLEAEGVRVFNGLRALLATHDKLHTSRVLTAAGLPHPRTRHVVSPRARTELEPPVVVKPRFGSWGRDVLLCEDRAQVRAALDELSARPWFRRQGVLVQELIPPLGHDLRIVVAAGQVVGAIQRVTAPGEWRTNVALGAQRLPADPPQAVRELALAAAAAAETDLVGIDLMPTSDGGWVVIEMNGAVEFTDVYSLDRNVFSAAAEALTCAAAATRSEPLAAVG